MTSPLHGEGRRFEFGRAHRLFFQSGARIEPQTDDGEYEELHNSDEKLCNFGLAESVESLAKIMTDRYIDEEGNEQVEMLWDELIPEEVVEWDEKNDPYMLKAEAKQLYSAAVTEKTNEGYTPSNDVVSSTSWNAYKLGTGFFVSYSYMQSVYSWAFITESG